MNTKSHRILPAEDRIVTCILVRGGETYVCTAEVLVSKENLIALAIRSSGQPLDKKKLNELEGASTTLLYATGELSYVLKARVKYTISPDRIMVVPEGEPHIGERREFIRAKVKLGLSVYEADHIKSLEELVQWARGFAGKETPLDYQVQTVDLSGSGARFVWTRHYRKRSFLVVSLNLGPDKIWKYLHLPAQVIRCKQAKESETYEVAVEFLALTQNQRDALVNIVFDARFRDLGMTPDFAEE